MLNSTVTPTSGRAVLGGIDVAPTRSGPGPSSVVFLDVVVDQPLSGRQNLKLDLKLWDVGRAVGRRRLAGPYPAMRAARLSPTEALRSV